MAIKPPSDIVLDVARAAEPQRLQSAYRALTEGVDLDQVGPGPDLKLAKTGFDKALRTVDTAPPLFGAPRVASEKEAIYRKLEQVVLERMIDYMLPKENALFGTGTAGHMWRGMVAEHMSKAIADAGGVGIARQLAVRSPIVATAKEPSA